MGTILFDIDGTLINTLHLYVESYLKTIKYYPELEMLTPEQLKEINPTSEYRTMEKIVGKDRAEEAYGYFLQSYCESYEEYFKGIFPGIISMLERLRQEKYKIGLVTGKSKKAWDFTVDKIQLGHFDVVITDNDVQNPKPDPEGLIKAAELLDVSPENRKNLVYVGDSLSDFMAAEKAGMIFGAALWSGWGDIKELKKNVKEREGSSFILKKPADLFEYI